jgi:hypothetical protein
MSLVINHNAQVAYHQGTGIAFVLGEDKHRIHDEGTPGKKAPHSFLVSDEEQIQAQGGEVYYWGEDNLRPQNIIRDCRKNPIIPSTIAWKAELLYSGGLQMGFEELRGDKLVLVAADKKKYPREAAFAKSIGMRRYLRQASKAYYWWKAIFPELILSRDGKQIVSVASQRPEYCRLKKEEDGVPRQMVLSANWSMGSPSLSDKHTSVVPLVDPYAYQPVEALRAAKGKKYIFPISDPSPGTIYYPEAEWHAVRESGWLKVTEAIPEFKRSLFANQITVKYLIEVSTWWWNWRYPGFDSFAAEEKKRLMDDELNNFINFMSGTDNAGKAIMVSFQSNPQFQKEYPGWKITAIDNKISDGIYIEDSQEANSHIMYALGVDPVLKGFTPGGKLASGGSEKRVAWNNHMMTTKPHQDDILEVIHFIHQYNQWEPDMVYWFGNYYQASLDVASSGVSKEPQQQAS